MKEDQLSPSTRAKSITLQLLDELLSTEAIQEVGFRLWDGTLWPDDQPRRGPAITQRYFFPDGELSLQSTSHYGQLKKPNLRYEM